MMEPCAEWEGASLLEVFLQNSISDHKPRSLTGKVECKKAGNVMTVQTTEYIDSIFKKLSVEGFLSAPVLRGRELVGKITLLDLVRHVNGLFFAENRDEWIDWWEKQLSFQLTPASSIIRDPDEYIRSPFPALHESFTSFYALEMMARNRTHQILQLDDQGQLCGILTQSMLISFLRQNKSKWGAEFTNLEVADFKDMLPTKKLQTVSEDDLTINAFLKMDEMDVHGLPIVDRSGTLTGCISVRDLRGVGTDGSSFSRLYQTVKSFKLLTSAEHRTVAPITHYSRKHTPSHAVYVTPRETMADVIHKMDDGNLHRIFICSQDSSDRGKPVPTGVISQSDVLYQALVIMMGMASKLQISETRRMRVASAKPSQRKVSSGRMPEQAPVRTRSTPGKRSIAISFD
jgi:CBS-domain-containing membrane protein